MGLLWRKMLAPDVFHFHPLCAITGHTIPPSYGERAQAFVAFSGINENTARASVANSKSSAHEQIPMIGWNWARFVLRN